MESDLQGLHGWISTGGPASADWTPTIEPLGLPINQYFRDSPSHIGTGINVLVKMSEQCCCHHFLTSETQTVKSASTSSHRFNVHPHRGQHDRSISLFEKKNETLQHKSDGST